MHHNPLLPSGSSSDDRQRDDSQHRKTKILVTVGAIVAMHVVPISGFLLLQGCKESGQDSVVDSGTNEETLLSDSNETNPNFENTESAGEDLLVVDGEAPDSLISDPETSEPLESAVSENSELLDGELNREEPGNWELGDSGENETPAPEPETEVVETPLPTTPTSHSLDYTIQWGDRLYSLAKKYGSTVDGIMGANPGIDPRRLRIGMSIVIPRNADSLQSTEPSNAGNEPPVNGKVYSVEKGDTLIQIARRNGIKLQALREANQLRSDTILIGQKLKIPAAEVAAAR